MEDYTKLLEKIGMTGGEVRVYMALLDLGVSSVGKIIDKSHITSSKVYLILERLEQKGLVSHIIKNNVKYFQATNPKRLLDYMNEKKKELEKETEEIKKIIPELSMKKKIVSEIQETTMYQGYKGIETAMLDFIDSLTKGDEYLVFGAKGPFGKKYELMVRRFYMKKAKKGIRTRLIYNNKYRSVSDLFKGIPHTKLRFIETITPSTIVISKEKILIITYSEESRAVLIQSKQIAESFWSFFESMWLVAKP